MATAYNGMPAYPDLRNCAPFTATLGGVAVRFPQGLRDNDDLRVCFTYLLEQWAARVEPPITGDYAVDGMWGANYRQNRNANNLSVHAAGGAVDYIATRHPNGSANTYTAKQYKEIARILEELEGVITVGIIGLRTAKGRLVGWTSGSKSDEMHKEATREDPAEWKRVAAKLRPKLGKVPAKVKAGNKKAGPNGSITKSGLTVKRAQTLLNRTGVKPQLAVDGVFGAQTTQAVRAFQAAHNLRVDGIIGPATWDVLKRWSTLYGWGKAKPAPVPAFPLKNGQVLGTPLEPGKRSDGTPWKSLTRSGYPKYGDTESIRNLVRAVQAKVGVKADGLYGDATKAAVTRWQRAHNLTADGMVGPATWKVMFA